MVPNRLRRRDNSDLDDNLASQKRYLSEKMAAELEVLSLNSNGQQTPYTIFSTDISRIFQSFNPFVRRKLNHGGKVSRNSPFLLDNSSFQFNVGPVPMKTTKNYKKEKKGKRGRREDKSIFTFNADVLLDQLFDSHRSHLISTNIPDLLASINRNDELAFLPKPHFSE